MTTTVSTNIVEAGETVRVSLLELARRYWLVGGVYVLTTLVTVPFFMADTIGYADCIVRRDFSDFGHYGWYLLGWLVSRPLMPVTRLFVGDEPQINVTLTLIIINWLAGLLSVLLLRSLAFQLTKRAFAANVATVALIFSLAFLDFAQSGTSYIPGMAFLLLGIYIFANRGRRTNVGWGAAIIAGLALGGAVAMWFTYIFAVPATLMTSLILHGFNRARFILAIQAAATASVFGVLLFGIGGYKLGLRSPEDFKQWVDRSSHGVHEMRGITRTIFGAGHSFIDMENDGTMVKAYLAKDPYNPVSFVDLVRASLWKLALFYVFLGSVVFNLVRSVEGRRVFALFAATALPVGCFAVLWQGGAIERYLLLYPVLFIAFAFSLVSDKAVRVLKYASLGFVAIMAVSNLMVMASPVQNNREHAVVARITELKPLLNSQSMVATINQTDEVWTLPWNFPFNPLNRPASLNTYHIVEPLTDQTRTWRESFATEVCMVWESGGDVWISDRVFSELPLREWNWIEGADPNLSWKEFNGFFSQMEMGVKVGGQDGFRLLRTSEQNRSLLTGIAEASANAGLTLTGVVKWQRQ